jgi:NhaA family Na+:H+ antiporter
MRWDPPVVEDVEPDELRIRPPWSRSGHRVARTVVRPLQAFLELEASSAALLLLATVAALVWSNSAWSASYARVWSTEVTIGVGRFALSEPLSTWIDEPLLGLFFLVVGLELKREVLTGEMRDRRALIPPVLAAVVGMAIPALLYAAFNAGGPGADGWAVPMATDVPFVLGVLILAGRGLPRTLRSFLLTLAIADDIGTLAVTAAFYQGHLSPVAGAIALLAVVVIWSMFRLRIQAVPLYVLLGVIALLAGMRAGVHATIVGFAIGLVVPATPFQRPAAVSAEAHRVADETVDHPDPPDADADAWLRLAGLSRQAVSPLRRLETALHPWTSNLVVPLFALSNAGVTLSLATLSAALTAPVFLGVLVGRVLGKAVGIPLGARIGTGRRLGTMPPGLGWFDLIALGGAGGVGFTVSLFVVELAFPPGSMADQAKLGLLVGSVAAAALGTALMRRRGRPG